MKRTDFPFLGFGAGLRRPHYSYVTETKMVTKCVDRGHWECREVYSHWKALCNKAGSLGHGLSLASGLALGKRLQA